MLRSHGMVRENWIRSGRKREYVDENPDLNPDFIFAFPAYNVRSTEINAIIGRSQLKRLDDGNRRRTENLSLFLQHLDPDLYRTDFATEGSSNYAFTLVLKEPDPGLCDRVMRSLAGQRRGVPARHGRRRGNQLRQPYLYASGSSDPMPGKRSLTPTTSTSTASTSAITRPSTGNGFSGCASCSTASPGDGAGSDPLSRSDWRIPGVSSV
jgi:dTDP-4-amino-4,6-dideoxygalactose transaminase